MAAGAVCAQREQGLQSLFKSIGELDPQRTDERTIALKTRGEARPAHTDSVPISQLAAFLRSARVVGTTVTDLGDWQLRQVSEVGLLEILQETWAKSRDEESAYRQTMAELCQAEYDHVTFQQFVSLLVVIVVLGLWPLALLLLVSRVLWPWHEVAPLHADLSSPPPSHPASPRPNRPEGPRAFTATEGYGSSTTERESSPEANVEAKENGGGAADRKRGGGLLYLQVLRRTFEFCCCAREE